MKSFKNYRPTERKDEQKDERKDERTENLPPQRSDSGAAAELTKKIASAWNGKSSADMLLKILSEAEKSKKNGELSDRDIDEFYEQFSPLLDGAQRRKLQIVVDRLKRI